MTRTNKKRLAQMRACSVKTVGVKSGGFSTDCLWARENDGKEFAIAEVPVIPAPGCRHCGCFYFASAGPMPTPEEHQKNLAELAEQGISITISQK
jgi:hypothetical protein